MSTIYRVHDDGRREPLWEDGDVRLSPKEIDKVTAHWMRTVALTPTGPFIVADLDTPIGAYALLVVSLGYTLETSGPGFDLLEPDPDTPEAIDY